MNFWLVKRGRGWLPGDEDAEKAHASYANGEFAPFKIISVRDPVAHRRYWALMDLCAKNCERIALPNRGVMLVKNKYNVHTAVKLWTGHYDSIFDAFGIEAYVIPKSTDFESMTKDEWNNYWPRVLDAVQEHILPGVSRPEVVKQIEGCMGIAA